MTIQELAREALSCFETATRGDTGRDEDRYTRCKDGTPEWVTELVHDAHGDMLPDDWKYECISAAVDAIEESDDPGDYQQEFADNYVDVYNGARIAWLSSHGARQGYCDEAASEFGTESHDVIELIGLGQYFEASEVYGSVLQSLEARLSDLELDEVAA